MQRSYPLVLAIATILLIGAGADSAPAGIGGFYRSPADPASQVRHPGIAMPGSAERSPCDARNELSSAMGVRIDAGKLGELRHGTRKRSGSPRACPDQRSGQDHVCADEAGTSAASLGASDHGIWLMERRGFDWSRPMHFLVQDGRTDVRTGPAGRLAPLASAISPGLSSGSPLIRHPAEPTVPHVEVGPGVPAQPR